MTPHICQGPGPCPHDHDEEPEHDWGEDGVCRDCGMFVVEYVCGPEHYARCEGPGE